MNEARWQPGSNRIFQEKYALRSDEGERTEQTREEAFARVAGALAEGEKEQAKWRDAFEEAMHAGAIPGGRIMANAGAGESREGTSAINCTVSRTIHDSMEGIMTGLHEGAMTLKAGCGIGYEFSTLRPKGWSVRGAGARTSGPIGFMQIYDQACRVIESAGARRGAQMATFDIGHPDVEALIEAKKTPGMLRNFNISLLIPNAFMAALEADADWPLAFPSRATPPDDGEASKASKASKTSKEWVWRNFSEADPQWTIGRDGRVACQVLRTIRARTLWDRIMRANWERGEPGVIFIDRVNAMNNAWFCEQIRATNPCGEQTLPPHGSCLLGSIDLTRMIRNPWTPQADTDWSGLDRLVRTFTRMLDNVVEIAALPLQAQTESLRSTRRHGMGVMGVGSALAMLGVRYGSVEATEWLARVMRTMVAAGWETGMELASEKGEAPALAAEYTMQSMLRARQPSVQWPADGTSMTGRELMLEGSGYWRALGTDDALAGLLRDIAKYGSRFTHHTSIAPTGTTAIAFGNNCSNGIEPTFAHEYARNMINSGDDSGVKEQLRMYSAEYWSWLSEHRDQPLPPAACVTDDLHWREHLIMQGTAQRWIDASVSKTINIATDTRPEDMAGIYDSAYASGCKGCTTFRFNPEFSQGVLSRDEDLRRLKVTFQFENGRSVSARANELVRYQGRTYTAGNLYEALREGKRQ